MDTKLMVRALRACRAWHVCEDKHIGTFQGRQELCSLSEYLVRKALGDDELGYTGVPYIALDEGLNAHLIRQTEEQSWALVEEAEDHIRRNGQA